MTRGTTFTTFASSGEVEFKCLKNKLTDTKKVVLAKSIASFDIVYISKENDINNNYYRQYMHNNTLGYE